MKINSDVLIVVKVHVNNLECDLLDLGCLQLLSQPLHGTLWLVGPGHCPFLHEGVVLQGEHHMTS